MKTLKSVSVKAIGILMILSVFGGCVSSTKMNIMALDVNGNPVNDATVMINGEVIGQTPNAQITASNFAGKGYDIIVTKDGYQTVRTEAVKEVKASNIMFGIFLFSIPAWFWIYGPKAQQIVELSPELAMAAE
jgi:hypothetical protein